MRIFCLIQLTRKKRHTIWFAHVINLFKPFNMKKILLLGALCFFGVQSSIAQEVKTDSTTTGTYRVKRNFYIAGGAQFTDFKLNDKLKASNLPEVKSGAFELSIGVNKTGKDFSSDLEWNVDYFADGKTPADRVRFLSTGLKWRPQYIVSKSDDMLFTAGLDLSWVINTVNIYTRGNVIDLDNLDPAQHSGHISLYNQNVYLGPSASFGVFQNSEFPLRLTAGYEWNLARATWRSEYAQVANTTKESGQGRFYAKIIWYL